MVYLRNLKNRFMCFTTSSRMRKTNCWDPTVSLNLNHPLLVHLEKDCKTMQHFDQVLAQIFKTNLITQTFPMSRIIYFTAIAHPVEENLKKAELLFNHFTPRPNLFIYNTMISGFCFWFDYSMKLYDSMLGSCIVPDEQTFIPLLKSCNSNIVGEILHAHVILSGFSLNTYLQNSVLKMYFELGSAEVARKVFEHMPHRDVVSYNIVIDGYARNGWCYEALEVFRDMLAMAVEPDQYTLVALIPCLGQLKNAVLGKSVHGWIIRKIPHCAWGLVLSNAVLDMYAKSEEMEIALSVFERLDEKDSFSWNTLITGFASVAEIDKAHLLFNKSPCKDLVSWNSLLTGFAKQGDAKKAMQIFRDMLSANVVPDRVTFVSLISVAEELGTLDHGRCVHGWVVKINGIIDAFLGSALVQMYSKCGSIEKSLCIFEKVNSKDMTLWTCMITSLAFHGYGTKALQLFTQMQEKGLVPNSVAVLAVLTACSHAGLVDEGYKIFKDMKQVYCTEPGIEHYGCMVDLLARSGRLVEAKNLIETMPLTPTRSMWGAILNACKISGNIELAEIALRELIKLQHEEEGGYVLLSNLYASHGKWSYSDKIREQMDNKGVRKTPGFSRVIVEC